MLQQIEPGSLVAALDYFGRQLPRRALTGVVRGQDGAVVWICSEEEWRTAETEGRSPRGIAWPAEDITIMRTT